MGGGWGGGAPWRDPSPPPPERSPERPPERSPGEAGPSGGWAGAGGARGSGLQARAEAVRERVRALRDLAEREGLGTPEELRQADAAVRRLPETFPEQIASAVPGVDGPGAAQFGGLSLEDALGSAPPRRRGLFGARDNALVETPAEGAVPPKRTAGRSRSNVEDFGGGLGDIMVAPRRGLMAHHVTEDATAGDNEGKYDPVPVRSRMGASERHRSSYFTRDEPGGESLDQCLGSPLRRRRQHLYANSDDYSLPGPDDKIDARTRAKIRALVYKPGIGHGEGQTECSICLENFEERQVVQQFKKCQHLFHAVCIKEWFETGDSRCPLCRQ